MNPEDTSDRDHENKSDKPDVPPPSVPVSVYLAPTRSLASKNILGQLATLYGLDVYGNSQMGRRARIEMYGIAVVLTVIFLFDLIAWATLFNLFFHMGLFQLSWRTSLAVCLGLLFAITTLIYERQFLTSDLSGSAGQSKWGPACAIFFRALVLVVAALGTSQSMELLIFDGPIKARIHEESVRSEIVNLLREFEDKKDRSAQAPDADKIRVWVNADPDRADRFNSASSGRSAAERNKDSVDESVRAAEVNRSRLIQLLPVRVADTREAFLKLSNDPDNERLRQQWQTWKTSEEQIARDIDNLNKRVLPDLYERQKEANAELKRRAAELTAVQAERQKAIDDLIAKQRIDNNAAGSDVASIREWIQKVRSNPPGVPLVAEEGRKFEDGTYNFFDRMRILADLRNGGPPRWPELSPGDRETISREFKIQDADDSDIKTQKQRASEARQFSFTYWTVFGIAVVIPLLIIAMKFLIAAELRQYYASAYQAALNEPEALAFIRASGQSKRGKNKQQ